MRSLSEIRGRLTDHRPAVLPLAGRRQAAVAALLRENMGRGTEILLIERARRRGDPWSGQIALPGRPWEHGCVGAAR